MKTNMQTIYAVKIMAYLYKKNVPCNSTEISQCVGTSPEHVQNILRKLRNNKSLISTTMGAHGGYMLARSPKKIALSEIFEALDDYPLFFIEKLKAPDGKHRGVPCKGEESIREHFRLMQEETDKRFMISLHELLTKYASHTE